MLDGAGPALGLSIGATNLAAVTADRAITRKPVLTLYWERPPEVGVPSENPGLDRPGLVITDFVNRVLDPRGVVAADGSVHRSEALIADGLRALAYAATGGGALPDNVAVTYPAHWTAQVVDALGAALSGVPEWSNSARPLLLIPDAAATLLAVRANPGIPPRGTVAVCDFGGSGTNITLMDAAGDYHALAPTVRHHEFSGQLIDQALLTTVIANMPSTASFDPSGTAAIGSLSRLRAGCRNAKEQLSASTVATLTDGLTGTRGEIQLTRHELDDAIRAALTNFVAVLDETLAHNGIRDLVAVVSAGGGANIPAVTTMLSQHLRVPVVTTPRPQLTSAIGAALRAARGPGETSATVSADAAPATATARAGLPPASAPRPGATATVQAPPAAPASGSMPALAWSQTDEKSDGGSADTAAHPASTAVSSPKRKTPVKRWYRPPAVAVIGTAVAVLLVGTAVAIGLSSANKSATPLPPGVSTTAPTPSPANGATAQPPPPTQPAPLPSTATNPSATAEAPTPRASHQAAPPAVAAPAAPVIPRAPEIPPLPPIPGIDEPIPGLDRVNQIIQGIAGSLGIDGIGQLAPH